jgi:hypothetical protein
MNLLGRVLSIAILPEPFQPCMMWVKGMSSGQPVELFNGLYTTNLRAHHALLIDDGTTFELGAIAMSLSSFMNSLLAAYAQGATGASCEFSRPE